MDGGLVVLVLNYATPVVLAVVFAGILVEGLSDNEVAQITGWLHANLPRAVTSRLWFQRFRYVVMYRHASSAKCFGKASGHSVVELPVGHRCSECMAFIGPERESWPIGTKFPEGKIII